MSVSAATGMRCQFNPVQTRAFYSVSHAYDYIAMIAWPGQQAWKSQPLSHLTRCRSTSQAPRGPGRHGVFVRTNEEPVPTQTLARPSGRWLSRSAAGCDSPQVH